MSNDTRYKLLQSRKLVEMITSDENHDGSCPVCVTWYPLKTCRVFFVFLRKYDTMHRFIDSIWITTPPKTNMEPENGPLEKEIPVGNHHFQVPC